MSFRRASEGRWPFQQSLRRAWPFQQLFGRSRPCLPEGATPSRLPALLPLSTGAKGPKRRPVILLMHRHRPLHPGCPGGARCLHPLHHAPSALRVFFELPPPCQRSRVFALQGKQSPVFLKHGVPSLTRHVIRLLARWVSRPRLGHENPHFRSSSISCCSPFSTLLYPLHSILRVLFATTN